METAGENQINSNNSSASQFGETCSNNGSVADSTKKQAVIVIPSRGPDEEEEDEGQHNRSSAKENKAKEKENHKTVEDNRIDNDPIDEGLGDMNGDAPVEKVEGNNIKDTTGNINEHQNVTSVNVCDSETVLQIEESKIQNRDTSNTVKADEIPNEEHIKPSPLLYNTRDYDANASLANAEHTLTHSIILDDQADEELERVMGTPGESSKPENGQGCAMCELCMQQNKPTNLALDYNLAFNKEQGPHDQAGMRGNVGTPNMYMEDMKFMIDGRGSRGTQPETKEAVFQQALSLMAERTVSRPASKSSYKHHPAYNRDSVAIGLRPREGTQTPIIGSKTYPFGLQQPEYFYVHQQKPSPMEPIPAWKGYNGNVYFAPIHINQAQPGTQSSPKSPDLERCSPTLQQIYMRSRSRNNHLGSASVYSGSTTSGRVQSGDSIRSRRAAMSRANQRSTSMMSTKSNQSKSSSHIGCKSMLVLDKRNVLTSSNDNIEEDIVILSSQESTGSLCVLEPGVYTGSPQRQQQNKHKKPTERIIKGSVVGRKITSKNSAKTRHDRPSLAVNGDKFNQMPSASPLLRTQTQYSQSNQRVLFSPELSYHSFTQSYEKLPPLEHLKASLRQIGNSPSKESLMQVITPQERMRFEDSMDYKKQPFLKFSPELRHHGVVVKSKPERHQSVN